MCAGDRFAKQHLGVERDVPNARPLSSDVRRKTMRYQFGSSDGRLLHKRPTPELGGCISNRPRRAAGAPGRAMRYGDASASAENALRVQPNYLTAIRGAAASHALAGRLGKALKLMARMRALDPVLRIPNIKDLIPPRRADDCRLA
jgi:hypothetical protein